MFVHEFLFLLVNLRRGKENHLAFHFNLEFVHE